MEQGNFSQQFGSNSHLKLDLWETIFAYNINHFKIILRPQLFWRLLKCRRLYDDIGPDVELMHRKFNPLTTVNSLSGGCLNQSTGILRIYHPAFQSAPWANLPLPLWTMPMLWVLYLWDIPHILMCTWCLYFKNGLGKTNFIVLV